MSKYHGLPDIDTAADVFETADEPDPPLRPSDGADGDDRPKVASELIDQSGLPARNRVEKAFRTRRRDGTYQLGLPPLSRQLSSSSDDQSDGRDGPSRPRETPAARIRRLRAELDDVEREVAEGTASASSSTIPANTEAGGQADAESGDRGSKGKRKSVLPPRAPVDLVSELAGLRERLAGLDSAGSRNISGIAIGNGGALLQRLRQATINGDGTGTATSESKPHAEQLDGAEGLDHGARGSVSDLDSRLASLEELIGTAGEGVDQNPSSPLLPTLNKLDHLLSLLTQPRHLDALSRRLKLLLVDLDRAAASSRRTGSSAPAGTASDPLSAVTLSSAEYTQLQSLFALLPRLDPLLPILPPLLARLRSLAALHAEAGRVAEGLKRLEEGDKGAREEVGELREAVRAVKEGLEEGGKRVLGNWEAVQSRMRDLEERVKRLNEG